MSVFVAGRCSMVLCEVRVLNDSMGEGEAFSSEKRWVAQTGTRLSN